MSVFKDIVALIGVLGITGAAATAAAFGLFRLLAKGWLQGQFDKDLADFRSKKDQELERLKAEFARLSDRNAKFHAKEYEVLPEAWGLLNKAHGAVFEAVSAFQQYPDLGKMTGDELEEFLSASDFQESKKRKIRESSDRNRTYSNVYTWVQISRGFRAQGEFYNYVILNGVFIEDAIAEKFVSAAKALRSAMIARQLSADDRGAGDMWQQAVKALEEVDPLVAEIKGDVRSRLRAIEFTEQV
jgi:hypothetical protein